MKDDPQEMNYRKHDLDAGDCSNNKEAVMMSNERSSDFKGSPKRTVQSTRKDMDVTREVNRSRSQSPGDRSPEKSLINKRQSKHPNIFLCQGLCALSQTTVPCHG